jgi:hypothetical protein
MMGSFIYGVTIVIIHLYAPLQPTIKDVSILTMVTYGIFAYALIAVGIVRYMRQKLLSSENIFKKSKDAKFPDQPSFLGNYLSVLFILWALCDVVTIGGVVLYLISAQLETPLILIGFGIFLKLVNGPKFEELITLEKRYAVIEMQG